MIKKCSKCKKTKDFKDFYKDKSRKDGHSNKCIDCSKKYIKEYNAQNPEYRKNYIKNNINKINKTRREYSKKKYKQNKLYKLRRNISNLIKKSFRVKGFKKTSLTYEILGCTFQEFYNHLQKTFKNNYGLDFNEKYLCYLELDHIKPISKAKTEKQIKQYNHYTNYQFLYWKDNHSKGNKIDFKIQKFPKNPKIRLDSIKK